MRRCSKCGTENSADAQLCRECGSELPTRDLERDVAPATASRWLLRAGVGASIVVAAVFAGFLVKWAFFGPQVRVVVEVPYERLLANDLEPTKTLASLGWAETELLRAVDPADGVASLMPPHPGQRTVQFDLLVTHFDDTDIRHISAGRFELIDESEASHPPIRVTVDGVVVESVHLEEDKPAETMLVFELPVATDPEELRYDAVDYFGFQPNHQIVVYRFE